MEMNKSCVPTVHLGQSQLLWQANACPFSLFPTQVIVGALYSPSPSRYRQQRHRRNMPITDDLQKLLIFCHKRFDRS